MSHVSWSVAVKIKFQNILVRCQNCLHLFSGFTVYFIRHSGLLRWVNFGSYIIFHVAWISSKHNRSRVNNIRIEIKCNIFISMNQMFTYKKVCKVLSNILSLKFYIKYSEYLTLLNVVCECNWSMFSNVNKSENFSSFWQDVTKLDKKKRIERVYCGHLYHYFCLYKFMKTPPFTGNLTYTLC